MLLWDSSFTGSGWYKKYQTHAPHGLLWLERVVESQQPTRWTSSSFCAEYWTHDQRQHEMFALKCIQCKLTELWSSHAPRQDCACTLETRVTVSYFVLLSAVCVTSTGPRDTREKPGWDVTHLLKAAKLSEAGGAAKLGACDTTTHSTSHSQKLPEVKVRSSLKEPNM